jgi:WD40 repeat protein
MNNIQNITYLLGLLTVSSLLSTLVFCEEQVIGTGEILDVAQSPDGHTITVLGGTELRLYDSETLEMKKLYSFSTEYNELKWSPDSRKIFLARLIRGLEDEVDLSRDNLVVDLEQENSREINETIKWFLVKNSPRARIETPLHNNAINFSHDSKELVLCNTSNQVVVYNLESGQKEFTYDFNEDVYAIGFTPDSGTLWISTVELIYYANQDDVIEIKFLYLERDINKLTAIKSLRVSYPPDFPPSSERYSDLTDDEQFIIELSYTGISTGVSISSWAYSVLSEEYINLSASVIDEYRILRPNQILYQPSKERFIVHLIKFYYGTILIKTLNDDEQTVIRFTPVSMFTEPYSSDGSKLYIGDYSFVRIHTGEIFYDGPDTYNYNLYALDWENAQYEHLLPKSAPELIAFQPSVLPTLLTHTNRKSKQFHYTREQNYPNMEMPLIKNKYSEPVSEFWSPEEESVVNEVTDMPLYEIGAFSDDGALFASPVLVGDSVLEKVVLYDTSTWQPRHEFVLDATTGVNHIDFPQGGGVFVTAHESVDVWDTNNGGLMAHLDDGKGRVFHTDSSGNNDKILTAGENGRVTEWGLSTGESNVLIQSVSPVIYVQYIGNKSRILYANNDGTAHVFDLQSKAVVQTIDSNLSGHSFRAVKLSPNENYLFVGSEVWDLQENRLVTTIAKTARRVEDLQISHDGKWLATRHEDFTARVWEVKTLIDSETKIKDCTNY